MEKTEERNQSPRTWSSRNYPVQTTEWRLEKKKKVNIASETCRTLIKDLTFMLPGLYKRRRKREG